MADDFISTSPEELSVKNYETFRECVAAVLVERTSTQPVRTSKRKTRKGRASRGSSSPQKIQNEDTPDLQQTMEELAEFIDYIATEIFDSLPDNIKSLDHYTWSKDADPTAHLSPPLTTDAVSALLPSPDPAMVDSLAAYQIIYDGAAGSASAAEFLTPVLNAYIAAVTAAPPPPRSTKQDASGCELCGRDWVPLAYHHLIPRLVHAKAVKRGWHREDQLDNVAWLCAACHRFVHRFANHEDLARSYYTVELLLAQAEVVAFADWVGRLRWKGGGTGSRPR